MSVRGSRRIPTIRRGQTASPEAASVGGDVVPTVPGESATAETVPAAKGAVEPPPVPAMAIETVPAGEGAVEPPPVPAMAIETVPVEAGSVEAGSATAARRRRRPRLALSRRIELGVTLLIVLNIAVIGGLLVVVVLDRLNDQARDVAAGVVVQPSSTPDTMQMGLAHIPTSAACTLCHDGGGKGGLKTVPAILHPIEGWRRCTVCHTNADLGRTAPGHDGIVEEECLNCHKTAPAGPAITQPHAALHDQHCLDCHGGVAHLPSSMATSREEDCVLCHKPATLPPPSYPHAPSVPLSCRSCHQSPEVGGLPIDHALRGDATCLLCHDIKRTGSSPTPSPPTTN